MGGSLTAMLGNCDGESASDENVVFIDGLYRAESVVQYCIDARFVSIHVEWGCIQDISGDVVSSASGARWEITTSSSRAT